MIFANWRITSSTLLLVIGVVFLALHSPEAQATKPVNLNVSPAWAKPEFSQYSTPTQTSQWRYSRKNATLYIVKAECSNCKSITQQDVAESLGPNASAVMLNHKSGSAMMRVVISPKKQLLRSFRMNTVGAAYEFQLGINVAMSSAESFALEQEFLEMINSFTPD